MHLRAVLRPLTFLLAVGTMTLLCTMASAVELGIRYTDSKLGFSIRPPRYWTVEREPMEGVSVVFVGPRHEGFVGTLNIVIQPEKIEVTPAYVSILARQLEAGHAREKARKRLLRAKAAQPDVGITDYRVKRTRIAKVAGEDAAFLEAAYSGTYNGRKRKTRNLQLVVPGPSRHYILTYTAIGEQYERYLPEVMASMATFTVVATALGPSALPASGKRKAAVALLVGLAAGIAVLVMARRRAGRRVA